MDEVQLAVELEYLIETLLAGHSGRYPHTIAAMARAATGIRKCVVDAEALKDEAQAIKKAMELEAEKDFNKEKVLETVRGLMAVTQAHDDLMTQQYDLAKQIEEFGLPEDLNGHISTLQGEVEVLKANSDSAATEIDNLTQQLATEQKRRLQAEQHLALLQQSGSAPDTFAQALTKWLGPPPASPPAAALSEQVDQMVGQLKDQKI